MSESSVARIFYGDDAAPFVYGRLTLDTVVSLGWKPLIYRGITHSVRSSHLHREIRADFYSSDAAILVIHDSFENHWAATELADFGNSTPPVALFFLAGADTARLPQAIESVSTTIFSADEYASALREYLVETVQP